MARFPALHASKATKDGQKPAFSALKTTKTQENCGKPKFCH
jgi:hypothetical protein